MTNQVNRNQSQWTLGDGTTVTWSDCEEATLELHAFFKINKLKFDEQRIQMLMPIPLELILREQPATTKEFLRLQAQSLALEDQKRNRLLRLDPKQDLNPKDRFYAMQDEQQFEQYRLDRHAGVLFEALQCLAKRKEGWTLLGFKSKKNLFDKVQECFSKEVADTARRMDCIPSWHLLRLIARKSKLQRGNRVQAIKSKTKTQRSADATKGWASKRYTVASRT